MLTHITTTEYIYIEHPSIWVDKSHFLLFSHGHRVVCTSSSWRRDDSRIRYRKNSSQQRQCYALGDVLLGNHRSCISRGCYLDTYHLQTSSASSVMVKALSARKEENCSSVKNKISNWEWKHNFKPGESDLCSICLSFQCLKLLFPFWALFD